MAETASRNTTTMIPENLLITLISQLSTYGFLVTDSKALLKYGAAKRVAPQPYAL
jgi:hypothetical protein